MSTVNNIYFLLKILARHYDNATLETDNAVLTFFSYFFNWIFFKITKVCRTPCLPTTRGPVPTLRIASTMLWPCSVMMSEMRVAFSPHAISWL